MGCHTVQRKHGGAILIVVLVCLALATALSVVVVRQIAVERLAAQWNDRSLQARWLVESGIERAAARLAADADYAGETWTLSVKQLAGRDGAVVRIQVDAVDDQPRQRTVRVEADYANGSEYRCRRAKQILVDLDAIQSQPSTQAAAEDR